ncbi:MAG: porin [Rhodocyclales bacterium]|nr:porin [Rhodocyclales bacterium]
MKKRYLILPKRALICAILGGLGLANAMPAFADAEIDALKREFADQKRLIERLLAAQESQKQINAKVEAQVTSVSQSTSSSAEPGGQSISFYGVADVNIASMDSGFGRKVSLGSGGMSSSRLGVKAERNLGSGLKAVGLAEAGLSLDTGVVGNGAVTAGINNAAPSSGGAVGTGTQVFSRVVYAGLASDKAGTVTIGRQYAGSFVVAASTANAMGVGLYGYSGSLLPLSGMPTRLNNSLVYLTPSMNGFSGWVTYTTGSENNLNVNTTVGATSTNDKAGQGHDVAVFYANGPLKAALSSWNLYNASFVTAGETRLAKRTGWQLAANYDFKIIKVFGTLVQGRIAGGNYENVTKTLSQTDGWSVSAHVPVGKHGFYASYSSFNDKSLQDKDARLVGLGYMYELYKNTNIYAAWGKMKNNANASYTLGDGGNLVGSVSTPGFAPSGLMTGVNVSF